MLIPRPPTFRVLDLFSGAGGLAEGFRQAGFNIVAANDFDPFASATYLRNHGPHGTKFFLGDITCERVREDILDYVRPAGIHVVVGGPPCQGFSQVRNHSRLIDDPRNGLYRQFVDIVHQLQPLAFVMENVPGLQNIAGGRVRDQIASDLSIGGTYSVRSAVIDAADFGVPQTRCRVFFVGILSSLGEVPRLPASRGLTSTVRLMRSELGRPLRDASLARYEVVVSESSRSSCDENGQFCPATLLKKLLDPDNVEFVTVKQAIGDLAYLSPPRELVRHSIVLSDAYRLPAMARYQLERRRAAQVAESIDVPWIRDDTCSRLKAIPQGGNLRDLPDLLKRRYLSGTHWGPATDNEMLSRMYSFAYRRLHEDYVSWTLNTKADCVYHYSSPRALSVREFARLQSFDDEYVFVDGDRHARYRQIGNAVPPLLARAVARELLTILDAREETAIDLPGRTKASAA